MKKKILLSLTILVFLSLGSNLLADHYTFDNMVQIGVIQDGNDDETGVLASALATIPLTYVNKWDGPSKPGNWTVSPDYPVVTDDSGYLSATFVWNGSGIITHIVVKASTHWILYSLTNPLNQGDSQDIVQSQITNDKGKPQAISHITGLSDGTTSVPEPATLMLLGIGLVAVPLTKKFTS